MLAFAVALIPSAWRVLLASVGSNIQTRSGRPTTVPRQIGQSPWLDPTDPAHRRQKRYFTPRLAVSAESEYLPTRTPDVVEVTDVISADAKKMCA
jgi:hypothetical protein